MKPEIIVIACIFVGFGALESIFTKFWKKPGQTRDDGITELVSGLALAAMTQPLILFLTTFAAGNLFPQQENALSGINVILGFLLLLVFDDMSQYWYHRACHETPWLYHLHRAHHNASYMSIRVVYRNSIFYYLLMPSIWLSSVLIYLGMGWIYAFYIVVKMLVIYGAHSDLAWDAPLYRVKSLSRIMWLVERTISTPSTHHAHHGKYRSDGITSYKGNYGNLLFFWDVLFGTAKITRQYPQEFGVENLPATSISEQLGWPLTLLNSRAKPGTTIPDSP